MFRNWQFPLTCCYLGMPMVGGRSPETPLLLAPGGSVLEGLDPPEDPLEDWGARGSLEGLREGLRDRGRRLGQEP